MLEQATTVEPELAGENLQQDEQMQLHEGHREPPAAGLKREAERGEFQDQEERPGKISQLAAQSSASELGPSSPTQSTWVCRSVGEAVPHELRCPISWLIMEDPVRTVDGQVYDHPSIEEWFMQGKTTSPMTNLI
jgi:hypothetical protein